MLTSWTLDGYEQTGEGCILLKDADTGKLLHLLPGPPRCCQVECAAEGPCGDTTGTLSADSSGSDLLLPDVEPVPVVASGWGSDGHAAAPMDTILKALEHTKVRYVLSSSSSAWGSDVDEDGGEHKDGRETTTSSSEGHEEQVGEVDRHPARAQTLPVHGSMLQLRAACHSDPFLISAVTTTDGPATVPAAYRLVCVLGYTAEGHVYLQPNSKLENATVNMPVVLTIKPILVLEQPEQLQRLYEDVTRNVVAHPHTYNPLGAGDLQVQGLSRLPTAPCTQLPVLRGTNIVSPPLLMSLLEPVYHVQPSQPYYLTALQRKVTFMGVACGVPWVVVADEVSPVCQPLPRCGHEGALIELYGLCCVSEGSCAGGGPLPGFTPRLHLLASLAAIPAASPSASCAASRTTSTNTTMRGSGSSTITNLPYFIRENKVAVPGPFGVLLECDTSPEVVTARFGVAHGDRLRERAGAQAESAAKATVMGVSLGVLVILYDHERKATVLRNVTGIAEVSRLYHKIAGVELPPPALPLIADPIGLKNAFPGTPDNPNLRSRRTSNSDRHTSETATMTPTEASCEVTPPRGLPLAPPAPPPSVAAPTPVRIPTMRKAVGVFASSREATPQEPSVTRESWSTALTPGHTAGAAAAVEDYTVTSFQAPPNLGEPEDEAAMGIIQGTVVGSTQQLPPQQDTVTSWQSSSWTADSMQAATVPCRSSSDVMPPPPPRVGVEAVQISPLHQQTPPAMPTVVAAASPSPTASVPPPPPLACRSDLKPTRGASVPKESVAVAGPSDVTPEHSQPTPPAAEERPWEGSSVTAVGHAPVGGKHDVILGHEGAFGDVTKRVDGDGEDDDECVSPPPTSSSTAFIRFLESFSLFQQRRGGRSDVGVSLPYLQQYYMAHSLDRVMAAVAAHRQCAKLWTLLRKTTPSLFPYEYFHELSVEEAAEFLELNAVRLGL